MNVAYCQIVERRYFEHLINWKHGNILKVTYTCAQARTHARTQIQPCNLHVVHF